MITFIVAGGQLDTGFLSRMLEEVAAGQERFIIAADSGVQRCFEIGVTPDYIVGDFDSADDGVYEAALECGAPVKKLNPIKDDTDSEAALGIALENVPDGDIYYLGGTGSRLDHVFGNVALLGKGLLAGRTVYLVDETNRIRMIGPGMTCEIQASEQYGKYVSVFPYMGQVTGLTMEGFKYPLQDATIGGYNTLTVSNEIVQYICKVSVGQGYLIIMETKD